MVKVSRVVQIGRGNGADDSDADERTDQQRLRPHGLGDDKTRRIEDAQELPPAAMHVMRNDVHEDVGQADECRGRMQIDPPAAMAEIKHHAGRRT